MAPNVSYPSPPAAVSTASFSLDALLAQCRQKRAAPLPDASHRPSFSLDAFIAQSRTKRTASAAAAACDRALTSEIDEITKKLSLLQKAKQRVFLKTTRVPEVMAERYPDLSIALAVQKSNKKRTWEVREAYGWRQYLGVSDMREKADGMIEREEADRFEMYDDLANELKSITVAIDEANARLANMKSKRSSEENGGKLAESPPKKRRNE